jgi:hypothetical protein
MAIFFLVTAQIFISSGGTETGEYSQMFHYSQLGDTIWEVCLSPMLNPKAFWGTLFAPNNLVFVLMLIFPSCFFLFERPLLLVAGLPILTGVCLQSSRDLQNVVLQYGVELNTLVIVVAVAGASHMLKTGNRRKLFGASVATLFGAIALHLLAGKTLVLGKYPFAAVAERPDASELIEFLKSKLPPGVTVHATPRIRAQLFFDFPTRSLASPIEPGSFYVMSLRPETMTQAELTTFRRKLASDSTIAPITSANWNDLEYVMFAKLPNPRKEQSLPFLKLISAEEFTKFGTLIPSENKDVEIRCRVLSNRGVQLGFRLTERAKSDLKFRISLIGKRDSLIKEISFANGLRPADTVEPGTAFFVQLPSLVDETPEKIHVQTII